MPSRKPAPVPPAPTPAAATLAERLLRSRTMASIPSERTSLEQRLASFMWTAGLRGWRRSSRVERTRPDFAFPRHRLAVFVDGCFWHGCQECCRRPASNTGYWHAKIDRNVQRDIQQTERVQAAGWTVLRFWGHEVERDPEGCALRVGLATMPDRHPLP